MRAGNHAYWRKFPVSRPTLPKYRNTKIAATEAVSMSMATARAISAIRVNARSTLNMALAALAWSSAT